MLNVAKKASPPARAGALRILSVLRDQGAGAGHTISITQFAQPFLSAPGGPRHVKPGANYALEKGWLEMVSAVRFRLTKAGYAQTIAPKRRRTKAKPAAVEAGEPEV
jgi:hypothetical protein